MLVKSYLWYQGIIRDFYGWWSPPAVEAVCPLNDPACFRPTQYGFPSMEAQLVPARGYVQTTLVIPVGSYIWGFMHNVNSGFDFQITDVSLNHELFSTPCPGSMLFPSSPFFFPEPYPVAGDGNFSCEIWNSGPEALMGMVLLVAEKKSANR